MVVVGCYLPTGVSLIYSSVWSTPPTLVNTQSRGVSEFPGEQRVSEFPGEQMSGAPWLSSWLISVFGTMLVSRFFNFL